MNPAIFATAGRVVFFPVRHHSPACARLLRDLARTLRPTAILIEGPSDFNPHLAELFLPHTLPIAIYSYVTLPDGARRGAFYPFCDYSPEWQALQVAREIGAQVRFIDLPWSEIAMEGAPGHRYADGELRRAEYTHVLCQKLGLEDFDSLWDTLFEIDPSLDLPTYMERMHHFAYHLRQSDPVNPLDARREACMLSHLLATLHDQPGPILVVTGGYHSYALYAGLTAQPLPASLAVHPYPAPNTLDPSSPIVDRPSDAPAALQVDPSPPSRLVDAAPATAVAPVCTLRPWEQPWIGSAAIRPQPEAVDPQPEAPLTSEENVPAACDRSRPDAALRLLEQPWIGSAAMRPQSQTLAGIALTPYSYARLDSLTGYDSGMPSPGFYHLVWEGRHTHAASIYRQLLSATVTHLRNRGQIAGTADLIAVETAARGLAALRGHQEVWRRDLIDAITSALVKEELVHGSTHPFLAALHAVFRGDARGQLAAGTSLPPLVRDIHNLLAQHDLEPVSQERIVSLDLHQALDLARSRVLHCLRILGIAGFERSGGSDLVRRTDLARIWEEWRIRWSPDLDAGLIEASIYGPTLAEAAVARLQEHAGTLERTAEGAALLLLDACLMGLEGERTVFYTRLAALIHEDGSFLSVTAALGHLLYLYRYDEVLGAVGDLAVGALLVACFGRGLWLLDALGRPAGINAGLLRGVGTLVDSYRRCASTLGLDSDILMETLHRVAGDSTQLPLVRGAAAGALWTLGQADLPRVRQSMLACALPDQLGDFLTGLFDLARETAQRQPDLVLSIDLLLMDYDDDAYLAALPALRLAFSYFTPREKHHLARTLLEAHGGRGAADLTVLAVAPEVAVRALALESRLFATITRYGLRGGA